MIFGIAWLLLCGRVVGELLTWAVMPVGAQLLPGLPGGIEWAEGMAHPGRAGLGGVDRAWGHNSLLSFFVLVT